MTNRTVIRCWIAAGACLLLNGCTVCELALRTVRYEPAAYSWKHDRQRSRRLYRDWAEAAWQQEQQAFVRQSPSQELGMGFRDGFVDYVYAGGTGEPPPVPPRRFWNAALRLPEGQARAQQWFDGYRRGAQAARDGGYREMATVRSSLMGLDAHDVAGYSEMDAPPDLNYREGPFEDDLPSPETTSQPDAQAAPSQVLPEPAPKLEGPATSEPASGERDKEKVVKEKPSQAKPAQIEGVAPQSAVEKLQDLQLPPIDSVEVPGQTDEPGGRQVAPPLEDSAPPDKPAPDAESLETDKQGNQESPTSMESCRNAVAAVAGPTSRLVLVQHVEVSQESYGTGSPSSTELRIVDRTSTSDRSAGAALDNRLPLTAPVNRASGASSAPTPSTRTAVRFVVGEQSRHPANQPRASTFGTNHASMLPTQSLIEENAPAGRELESANGDFAR